MARPAAAWVFLGLGLIATLAASVGAWRQASLRDEWRFHAASETIRSGILQELDRYVRILHSARALWQVHPPQTQAEWRDYVKGLNLTASLPGLKGLGYVERVPSARLPLFLEQVRLDNPHDLDAADSQRRPPTPSEEHYLVKFIEPLAPNQSALGYDIGSEPVRRLAAEQARDTGRPALSRRISLVQAPSASGALLLLPVYTPGIQTTNIALRRAHLIGWVDVAFLVEDVVSSLWLRSDQKLDFQVFDGPNPSPAAELFDTRKLRPSGGRTPNRPFARTVELPFDNGAWTVRFLESGQFDRTAWLSAPGYVSAAALGFFISLLIFGIARSQATMRERAQRLADEMTARSRLQQHAMDSATNGLFLLDARREGYPIIYANPAFQRLSGYCAGDHLGTETLHLLEPPTAQPVLPAMRALLRAGGSDRAVVRECNGRGGRFWAEYRLLPVLDEHGQRTHLLGILDDVTDRKRAQDQLHRAEQRHRELLDRLSVGVYRNTPGDRGRFLEVNPACVAMFEADSREELMKRTISELYVDPARRREFSDKLVRQGFVKDEELELKTLRGRTFWASVSASMKEDGKEGPVFDGVITDITERKQALESLQHERRLMRTVLDNLPDVIYAKDMACRKTLTNRADLEIMGRRNADEVLGKTDYELYPAKAAAGFFADDECVVRQGRAVLNRDEFFIDAAGQERWLLTSKIPLRNQDGQIVGLVGIGHDITERKLAERALQASEERFALAVQGANDGIWDWNVATGETYFSPRWKNMLGYDDQEIENSFSAWEQLLHPEDRARARAAIQAYFSRQSECYELEHRLRHKDGSYRWILARGVALRGAQGRPLRMAGSHVDLTARKEAEQRLQHTCRELAQSREELKQTIVELKASHEELHRTQLQLIQAAKMDCIGTLAAGVAHEVKNPLQTILIGVDYLTNSLPEAPENLTLALGEMRDAIWRANGIIRELLQLSAPAAFELVEGDLNAVVERSLRLVNAELVAAQVRLECRFTPGPLRVRMDAAKLEQVFLNLFMNALQAMSRQGTLRVTTTTGELGKDLNLNGTLAARFSPQDRLVVAQIQDTGPGIAPEHLNRIYDPFFTTKPAGKGTGLGLSVVKKIVALHEGALEIQNAPEGGALATLALRA